MSQTPTSQVVSAHTYQPSASTTTSQSQLQSQTLNSMQQKSSNYSQLQTPTTATLKSHKPPIGNESAKQQNNQSQSLHRAARAAPSNANSQVKRLSPRSTLNSMTKIKDQADSRTSGMHKHASFSSSQQNLSTFSPKEDNHSKRRNESKQSTHGATSAQQNKNHSQQSLKAQVS